MLVFDGKAVKLFVGIRLRDIGSCVKTSQALT